MERELQTALLVNPSCLIGRDRSPKSNADHGIIGQPAEMGAVFVLRAVRIEHDMIRNSVSVRAAFSGVTAEVLRTGRRRIGFRQVPDGRHNGVGGGAGAGGGTLAHRGGWRRQEPGAIPLGRRRSFSDYRAQMARRMNGVGPEDRPDPGGHRRDGAERAEGETPSRGC